MRHASTDRFAHLVVNFDARFAFAFVPTADPAEVLGGARAVWRAVSDSSTSADKGPTPSSISSITTLPKSASPISAGSVARCQACVAHSLVASTHAPSSSLLSFLKRFSRANHRYTLLRVAAFMAVTACGLNPRPRPVAAMASQSAPQVEIVKCSLPLLIARPVSVPLRRHYRIGVG